MSFRTSWDLSFDRVVTWIAVILLVCTLYGLYKGWYNIYLHPLSTIPGPKLAAATKLPIAVNLRNGRLPQWLLELHEDYGSQIIRISPDEISVISPSAWTEVYTHHQGRLNFPKDHNIYTGVNNIITANDADHSRMRRLLGHAFSDKALREQEPILQGHIDELARGLHTVIQGPKNGKVDLVNWYYWIAFDNIGDLAFGESFHCLTTNNFHPWVESLISVLQFIVLNSVFVRFPPLQKVLSMVLMTDKARKARAAHRQLAAEKVEKRMSMDTTRPDFMSYIMRHNDTKSGMTQEEIQVNAETLIAAGSETTAGILSGFTWCILKTPDCLQKVQDEIREACKTREHVTLQNVESLTFFNAAINETFRLYPTALAGQPRKVPVGGATVCGHHIAAGTGIQMNQYAAFNSRQNFSDPCKFVPERWLEKKKDCYRDDKTEILQPFSVGARNCIGKNLAMAEIRLVLARMLWEFDMVLYNETDENWPDQQAWMTWQQKPLFVRLTDRS